VLTADELDETAVPPLVQHGNDGVESIRVDAAGDQLFDQSGSGKHFKNTLAACLAK
jgi:hypothetical protein